ncbi:hypothetical protein [Laspinema olomoucense]|uniref:Uncharacterized protein n=1 Tax=Laspinema olomoucense D3b TaxID=2953688 RepID=A0ABT2NE12_9CYAN|nr:hypothetical protein [Laspinema sp. D3b]MCT7980932.1 hypothetical protein [Laspinema sp. D3b]
MKSLLQRNKFSFYPVQRPDFSRVFFLLWGDRLLLWAESRVTPGGSCWEMSEVLATKEEI